MILVIKWGKIPFFPLKFGGKSILAPIFEENFKKSAQLCTIVVNWSLFPRTMTLWNFWSQLCNFVQKKASSLGFWLNFQIFAATHRNSSYFLHLVYFSLCNLYFISLWSPKSLFWCSCIYLVVKQWILLDISSCRR